jgi:Fungal Zn(2)-Cys(6) binuclear cluster domain
MSSEAPSPSSSLPLKPPRVLACVLCQQRKVKCDRKFPCANCVKSRAQCVPATLTHRRRRRRFPERELLDRLRKYEDLLRLNSVSFEPLHKDSTADNKSNDARSDGDSEAHDPETAPTFSTTRVCGRRYEAKYAVVCRAGRKRLIFLGVSGTPLAEEYDHIAIDPIFTDNSDSFETLKTIAILHTMKCVRQRLK